MNWLKPTKANIAGTGLVYLAMLLSSAWDYFLFYNLFYTEFSELTNTARASIDLFSKPIYVSVAVMVVSPAMQIILLYTAVSFAIHLAKTKYGSKK